MLYGAPRAEQALDTQVRQGLEVPADRGEEEATEAREDGKGQSSAAPASNVVNIMDALKKSIQAVLKGRKAG